MDLPVKEVLELGVWSIARRAQPMTVCVDSWGVGIGERKERIQNVKRITPKTYNSNSTVRLDILRGVSGMNKGGSRSYCLWQLHTQ